MNDLIILASAISLLAFSVWLAVASFKKGYHSETLFTVPEWHVVGKAGQFDGVIWEATIPDPFGKPTIVRYVSHK